MPAILAGALIALVGGSLLFNGMISSANGETSATPAIFVSDTPLVGIPVTMGVGSILHFQDGSALLDQATLIAQAMPVSPAGHQYKVWLLGRRAASAWRPARGWQRQSGLTFSDLQNPRSPGDLLGSRSRRTGPDPDPNGATNTAYAYALRRLDAYMRAPGF
jgi:hypothetical protein